MLQSPRPVSPQPNSPWTWYLISFPKNVRNERVRQLTLAIYLSLLMIPHQANTLFCKFSTWWSLELLQPSFSVEHCTIVADVLRKPTLPQLYDISSSACLNLSGALEKILENVGVPPFELGTKHPGGKARTTAESALQWLSSSLWKTLFSCTVMALHRNTIIELMQHEVDEKVSSRHRNWREENNSRSSLKSLYEHEHNSWHYSKQISSRNNQCTVKGHTTCQMQHFLIQIGCYIFLCPSFNWQSSHIQKLNVTLLGEGRLGSFH